MGDCTPLFGGGQSALQWGKAQCLFLLLLRLVLSAQPSSGTGWDFSCLWKCLQCSLSGVTPGMLSPETTLTAFELWHSERLSRKKMLNMQQSSSAVSLEECSLEVHGNSMSIMCAALSHVLPQPSYLMSYNRWLVCIPLWSLTCFAIGFWDLVAIFLLWRWQKIANVNSAEFLVNK